MRLRTITAALLCAPILTACAVGSQPRDAGPTADARGAAAQRMADLLLSMAVEGADPVGSFGWAGSWLDCEDYFGHQVEFRASGSFDVESRGHQHVDDIAEAAKTSEWQVSGLHIRGSHVSFDLAGDGVRGHLSVGPQFAELYVGTGCITVSGEDADRLLAQPSVSSDD